MLKIVVKGSFHICFSIQYYFVLCCLVDKKTTAYCNITLSDETLKAFVYAVKNHYWYQMYIDDLPIWGRTCILCT